MNFDGNQQFMVKIIPDGSLGAAWRRRWALFGTLRLTIDKCVLSLLGAHFPGLLAETHNERAP